MGKKSLDFLLKATFVKSLVSGVVALTWLYAGKEREDMATYLSKNFTLEELVYSDTAKRYGLNNTPTPQVIANLKNLIQRP